MLKTALGRFRIIALYEGISYLVLLIIAMPMKYWMDIPQPVTIVGGIHGLLFVLYMLALAQVAYQKKWKMDAIAFAVIASIIPFATFILESRLKKQSP
ncbi:DUF3817 domain-containing protein [Paenibacillus sp. GCM10012307]|uniref:DUF3817 domain-containing protein n=1 Tax=Paenibacillus roseus TaxID=2798579 RepID=A0A934MSL4_9BACL|nr:DUF3817 domain-containing protein [Paenibacillus roseus]MBJ6364058.1 DUF3817 domain-containing protein [Paenibacillus roseus]